MDVLEQIVVGQREDRMPRVEVLRNEVGVMGFIKDLLITEADGERLEILLVSARQSVLRR